MKPGIPWSVKGIEPEAREAAKHAARRAGMTLGEWLNTVILDQSEPESASVDAPVPHYVPADLEIPRKSPSPSRREPEFDSGRRESATVRLEDIAHQLSQLAQRERESATIQSYDAPRARDEDREALNRILSRIDSNERQSVEAFTAVNERLSVLGRQISMAQKAPQPLFEKPEDVPGFSALEGAIRNVVEHLELSEKRTRDSLRTMQDRLAEMAERATQQTNPEDLVRAAPAFAGLEARIAEMASRVQRSENMLQAGLPEIVRDEMARLADRIEEVGASAEKLASDARSSALGAARGELREIESRILGVLKEAQATIGSQQTTAHDLQRLRSEIGGINKRIDDVKQATATERDVHALKVAVEQLSTRVAQGPDMRPLADMDRRLGELSSRLEQNHLATRNLPQFGELERRIAELDHRLADAMQMQGDHQAIAALQEQIEAVTDRVGHTEEQLGHLETMERAIHQLYESIEQNREFASQTAEEAANRAVERMLTAQQTAGPSPELRALQEGLQAVRESAAGAEQRNQETLEAVHETLEQIVNKLAELETASAGHQLAANMAQQASGRQTASDWQAQEAAAPAADMASHDSQPFYDPTGAFDQPTVPHQPEIDQQDDEPVFPEPSDVSEQAAKPVFSPEMPQPMGAPTGPAPDFSAGAAAAIGGGDDFIAAARRAAQAAASRPSVLHPDVKPDMKTGANSGFRLSLPFLKGKKENKPITYVGGKPVTVEPAQTSSNSKRKKLVLAGIVLLAAVSAFAFNMLAKSPKPPKQSTSIEAPFKIDPAKQMASPEMSGSPAPKTNSQSGLGGPGFEDKLVTGSLQAKKTDATIQSIVAEPGTAADAAELPPPEVGNLALRDAAKRGDAKAQFIVASRYLDGQGIAQDLPLAAKWYQLAASSGLAPAQYRLATLFERGKGVPQDAATALLWYERAAEGGNVKAMHNTAVIAAGNQAGTPNYDKAFKWFKSAADRGLFDSQFNLAVLYERGLGTKIDTPEAYFWYKLAANQGDKDAGARAQALAKSMPAEEVTETEARVASWVPEPTVDDANMVAITDPVWNETAPAAGTDSMSVLSAASMAETAPSMTYADPIMEAQTLLTRLGYNVGTPDGKMGSRTANAVRLFQLQTGLKVTGEITPDLLSAMRDKAG